MGSDPGLNLHSPLEVYSFEGKDSISCSGIDDFILIGEGTNAETEGETCFTLRSSVGQYDTSPPPYNESEQVAAERVVVQLPRTLSRSSHTITRAMLFTKVGMFISEQHAYPFHLTLICNFTRIKYINSNHSHY